METKEELMGGIRDWVRMDNDILKLKAQMKDLNTKKKELTDKLMNVMKKTRSTALISKVALFPIRRTL